MHDQVEVVIGGQVADAVAAPAELARLPLDRSPRHQLELVCHPGREPAAEEPAVVAQRGPRQDDERVAGIDRERDAVLEVEGRVSPAQQARILDVVVDEEGVVE